MSYPSISVIVTTYNWPAALAQILSALAAQSYPAMEVIIADDGSREETKSLIASWQSRFPFPLKHCWQPDDGFRAAQIRNKAVAMASHEYMVFLDGDCIPQPHFVKRHAHLAEKGWFVAGNRLLLNAAFTQKSLQGSLQLHQRRLSAWLLTRLRGGCNRWGTLVPLPLGMLRKWTRSRWQGVKTCNLGLWRDDFLRINGFDEDFVGWGFEDSDLVIRLLRMGIYRKQGKSAVTVLHLWHVEQPRSQLDANQALLDQTLRENRIRALKGVDQYRQESHDAAQPIS